MRLSLVHYVMFLKHFDLFNVFHLYLLVADDNMIVGAVVIFLNLVCQELKG